MNIREIRAFVAVARSMSFSKAAKEQFITQPALSRLIASLEEELEIRLFQRTTRSVELTPEGARCLPLAERIAESCEALMREAESCKRSAAGMLNVGYNPLAGQPEFFMNALAEFSTRFPNVKLNIIRDYSVELVNSVMSGELDCALVSEAYIPDGAPMARVPLQRIRVCILARRDSPLSARGEISVRELSGMTITLMKESAPRTYEGFVSLMEKCGVPFVEGVPANDLDELIFRVRMGNSVGITSFVDPDRLYDDLVAIDIAEYPRSLVRYRVLTWRQDCSNHFVSELCGIISDTYTPDL